jgi:hypothetical protein
MHFVLLPILYAGRYFFLSSIYWLLTCTVPHSSPLPIASKSNTAKRCGSQRASFPIRVHLKTGHALRHAGDGQSARVYASSFYLGLKHKSSPEIWDRAVTCFKVGWSIIERGTTSVCVTTDISFSTAATIIFCLSTSNVHVPKFLRNDNQRTGDLRPGLTLSAVQVSTNRPRERLDTGRR